jgi:sulfite dehydrogenase (quinone) subunit SoeC
MHGALSVLLFTVTAGLGQGLFVCLALAGMGLGSPSGPGWSATSLATGGLISLCLLGAGLVASFFHLGRPERAWRTAAMWRTSWLSREVIVLPATMAVIAGWTLACWLGWSVSHSAAVAALALTGIALCGVLWVSTAMIYACLKFLQEWAHWSTPLNFMLMGLASGAALATVLAAIMTPSAAGFWAAAAILLTVMAAFTRFASMRRNASLRPRSTIQSAIGIQEPKVRQIAQGATGGSFNTREFFHHRPPLFVRTMRAWALIGGALLPCALLLLPGVSWAALAVVVQYTALVAERWLFFADARHPQNLYYQSVS